MSNKDLFKQAIAEAKTIREAAITNAKEALEESLTPHLKEMLAQKLQEMEDAEDMEEIVNEEDLINNPEGETAHGNVAEAEEEEEEAEEAEGEEAEEEGEEEGEEAEAEEEELDLENMSVEEFKDLVRDIVAQEIGQEGSEEEIPGEEAPEGAEDMVGAESEEEIDINELLAELAEMDGKEEETIDENVDIVYELIQMFPFLTNSTAEMLLGVFGAMGLTSAAAIMAKVQDLALNGTFGEKAKAFATNLQKSGKDAFDVTQQRESIDEEVLNESLMGQVVDLLGVTNSQAEMILGVLGAMGLAGASAVMAKVQDLALKGTFGDRAKANAQKLSKYGSMAGSVTQQQSFKKDAEESNEELEEALATVAELRTQLQEVNLLNAKLLYVNKVFKANNLTESQKVNVVAAFDKAETVKEVKLVFETVSKNVVAKPAAIKEHKSFASSAAGTAATAGKKEIISEVSEQVARWQKLAGIIK